MKVQRIWSFVGCFVLISAVSACCCSSQSAPAPAHQDISTDAGQRGMLTSTDKSDSVSSGRDNMTRTRGKAQTSH